VILGTRKPTKWAAASVKNKARARMTLAEAIMK